MKKKACVVIFIQLLIVNTSRISLKDQPRIMKNGFLVSTFAFCAQTSNKFRLSQNEGGRRTYIGAIKRKITILRAARARSSKAGRADIPFRSSHFSGSALL